MCEDKFIEACKKDDISVAKEILSNKDFNPAFDENSSIHLAMLYESVGVLKLLLEDQRMKYDVEKLVKLAKSKKVLEVLEKFRKKQEVCKKECYGNDCPICLDKTDDMFVMNPCRHAIHLSCVEGMIKKECPVCRVNVENWPENVEQNLNTNIAKHREEVIREEQQAIRAQEAAIAALPPPFLVISALLNEGIVDGDDSTEDDGGAEDDDASEDGDSFEEAFSGTQNPFHFPSFGGFIVPLGAYPHPAQTQPNAQRTQTNFPPFFRLVQPNRPQVQQNRPGEQPDLGFLNFLSDADLAIALANNPLS